MDELSTYDPFATAEDFATFLRRDLSGFDTASAEDALAASSSEIRDYCEWQIWPRLVDDVLTVDGRGGFELVLPVPHVTDVASVVEDGATLVEGDDYEWSYEGILERRGTWWIIKRRAIVITLSHGYSVAPPTLKNMSMSVAARSFASPAGEIREQAGAVAVTHSQTAPGVSGGIVLLDGDRRRLGRYRGGYR